MKFLKTKFLLLGVLFLLMPFPPAEAVEGKVIIAQNKCGSCHKMTGPPAKTIAEVLARKAPDLFYAGSKFQEEFLVEFSQRPYRVRPTGTVYVNNIETGEEGKIDRLIQNPSLCASGLSQEDAIAAAKYLMTFKDKDMKTGVYQPGAKFFRARAKLIFFKSTACSGCHQVKKRNKVEGGVSGPTLYNAGSRLNGDWVYSFIKDPHYWDPKVWMPELDLPDNTWLLLTNFVMTMKQ